MHVFVLLKQLLIQRIDIVSPSNNPVLARIPLEQLQLVDNGPLLIPVPIKSLVDGFVIAIGRHPLIVLAVLLISVDVVREDSLVDVVLGELPRQFGHLDEVILLVRQLHVLVLILVLSVVQVP